MINKEMAKDYLERSLRCLEEAEISFSKKDYAGTVRRSQESLELAIKSLLRSLGVEYPREHDISEALIAERNRLPEELAREVDSLSPLVRELASLRGPAMYGYEREGIPASRAFKEEYARNVLATVRKHVKSIEAVLRKIL